MIATDHTLIMGVLNVTPDSFSDGGKYFDTDKAVLRALEMEGEGADMIDIGGESSRPGSESVSEKTEIERVLPVLKAIRGKINVPISVDTHKSAVARRALENGAEFINDVTALHGDKDMAKVIADFSAGVILMHMQGDPRTMQKAPSYGNVVREIKDYLDGSIRAAIKAGIDPGKIIVDPGIGFGKNLEHNLLILKNLHEFRSLGKPVLVGVSRKYFIGEITGKAAAARQFGTAAAVAASILNGADILRVHDVGDMKDVAKVIDRIKSI
ncbi:MAG: dihydropteroate synthase [Candidatus Omnitrophica bacterium]|nr:dihydropteroate synthase [Candidatus Omnitrophota bacterium]